MNDLADTHDGLWFVGSGNVPGVASDLEADKLAARRHARHE